MGITKLADLVRFDAPDAISCKDINEYSGEQGSIHVLCITLINV